MTPPKSSCRGSEHSREQKDAVHEDQEGLFSEKEGDIIDAVADSDSESAPENVIL